MLLLFYVQFLSVIVTDLLRVFDGLGRKSKRTFKTSKYPLEWFRGYRREVDAREDKAKMKAKETKLVETFWEYVRGDEGVRPNRDVLMPEWLEAVNACFEENFIYNAKNKDTVSVDMEMMVGQEWETRSKEDYEAYQKAREKYTEEVVALTARVAKEAESDPELSMEVKAIWTQMRHKVTIVLTVPDPKTPWRPWFPLLTRSVYKMLVRRFESVKETLHEVSDRSLLVRTIVQSCR